MKILKKFNFAVLAVVLGLGLVFTQSAFKSVKTTTVYHYMSDSPEEEDLRTISNWEASDPGSPSCGLDGDLVCRYEFDGNLTAFQAFIEDPGTDVQADINENALTTKVSD